MIIQGRKKKAQFKMYSSISTEIPHIWKKYESKDQHLGYLLCTTDNPAEKWNTVSKIGVERVFLGDSRII